MAVSSDSPPLTVARGSFRPKLSGSLPIAGPGRCTWTAQELNLQGRRPSLLVPTLLFLVVFGVVMVVVSGLIANGRVSTDEDGMEVMAKVVLLPLAIGFLALVRPIPGLMRRRLTIAWRDVEAVEAQVDRVVLGVRRGSLLRLEFVPKGGIDQAHELAAIWRDLVTVAGYPDTSVLTGGSSSSGRGDTTFPRA